MFEMPVTEGSRRSLGGPDVGDGSNETSRAYFDCSVTVVETALKGVVVFESFDGLLCSILEAYEVHTTAAFLALG
jgi:hypothetical protein